MNAISQGLKVLYNNKLNDLLSIYKQLSKLEIDDYSSPLLMTCSDDYENASYPKILYIGKETNKWYEKGACALMTNNPINHILDFYKTFSLGKDDNRIFWKFIKKCNKRLSVQGNAFMWTNVNKFGKASGRGCPHPQIIELEKSHFNVLEEEINIIKPDVVLFLSGRGYDDNIINKLGTETVFEDIPSFSCFSKVKHSSLPDKSFRIYHPLYLNFKQKTDSYIDKLVE